jgi:hypothetical protein
MQCWAVLTSRLKIGVGFQCENQLVRITMKTFLGILMFAYVNTIKIHFHITYFVFLFLVLMFLFLNHIILFCSLFAS